MFVYRLWSFGMRNWYTSMFSYKMEYLQAIAVINIPVFGKLSFSHFSISVFPPT